MSSSRPGTSHHNPTDDYEISLFAPEYDSLIDGSLSNDTSGSQAGEDDVVEVGRVVNSKARRKLGDTIVLDSSEDEGASGMSKVKPSLEEIAEMESEVKEYQEMIAKFKMLHARDEAIGVENLGEIKGKIVAPEDVEESCTEEPLVIPQGSRNETVRLLTLAYFHYKKAEKISSGEKADKDFSLKRAKLANEFMKRVSRLSRSEIEWDKFLSWALKSGVKKQNIFSSYTEEDGEDFYTLHDTDLTCFLKKNGQSFCYAKNALSRKAKWYPFLSQLETKWKEIVLRSKPEVSDSDSD